MPSNYSYPATYDTGWVSLPKEEQDGLPRLYCFASAGGSAELFRQWQPQLMGVLTVCPVELPGRGRRMGEPFCASLVDAASAAADAIAASGPGPYALFGHSLGSVLVLETARALQQKGHNPANCIFFSGRLAPHTAHGSRQIHTCTETQLIDELRRLGGTQEEILTNRDLLDFILPIVRDDYRLLETYSPQVQPKLNSPLHVCCGNTDADAPHHMLKHWEDLSEKTCHITLFNGGHFYINEEQDKLIDYIKAAAKKHFII